MIRFVVPDMECQGCVRAVTGAVQEIDPAASVNADLTSHVVEIVSTAPADSLGAAITGAGFTVQAAA